MKVFSRHTICTGLLLVFFLAGLAGGNVYAQQATLDYAVNDVSKVRQVLTNLGSLIGHPAELGYPGLIRCEFPPNSGIEHIGEGGIWFGGITPKNDTLVTSTLSWAPSPFWETYPTSQPWDTVWSVRRGEVVDIPYWPNYKGVSDQDFVMRYNDYGPASQRVGRHQPLFLDIVQTSYHWAGPPGLDEIIVHTYYIVPKKIPIENGYFTFWLDPNVGDPTRGTQFLDDFTRFNDQYNMAYSGDAEGGPDGTAESFIGAMIFPPDTIPKRNLKRTFKWGEQAYAPGMIPPTDGAKYRQLMSDGEIMQNQQNATGAHFTYSIGPFDLNPGDTLKMRVAQILGNSVEDMKSNAKMVKNLIQQNFKVPAPPPVPPLTVTPINHGVKLNWEPKNGVNPENYTDPNRADNADKPFEGYRLYKSTKSAEGPWTLLGVFDIKNNPFGINTGLQHTFTDKALLNNVKYYYSVTAFSKPDTVLGWPSLETSKLTNAKTVTPGTPPPESVGKVAVVPNPYRGDISYQDYNPPWEKPPPSRDRWLEQDRRVQFINLPAHCRIKVYTVTGELVKTITHHNPNKGFEDWNLTSNIGQAISHGIYVYTVKDLESGKVQEGRFVVLK